MPEVERPVSSDGNRAEEPISSELAGDGENIFKAVGDNIVAGGSVMTFVSTKVF